MGFTGTGFGSGSSAAGGVKYKVDPEALKGAAGGIEIKGKDIYSELNSAYTKVGTMHSFWKGLRYSKLVEAFNNITTDLNAIIEDVTTNIPKALRQAVTNYYAGDTSDSTGGTAGEASKIENIERPSDSIIEFDEGQIELYKTQIMTSFKNAKADITSAKNIVVALGTSGQWSGEAYNSAQTNLTNYESKINEQIESLNTDFETAIKATITDMTSAENANTVNN